MPHPNDPAAPKPQLPESGDVVRLEWSPDGTQLSARIAGRHDLILTATIDPQEATPAGRGSVVLLLDRPDALYRFSAELLEQLDGDVWKLRLGDGPPERVQRREDFRLSASLPLLVAAPHRASEPVRAPESAAELRTAAGAHFRIFRLRDLSGGGCCAVGGEPWLALTSEHRGFLYLPDSGGPLPLNMRVVRRTDALTAFQFLDLDAPARERILRALYREYRMRRARGLESA